jgi:hypothetical protein
MTYTWDDLAGLARARQFPPTDGLDPTDPAAVAVMLERVGPVQSQTARSPFLALAARLPGVTLETVSAAYDAHRIVRGSNLRGTVHTSPAADHPLLEVATRTGQRAWWRRSLRLGARSLEEVWDSIEEFAHDEWRTPVELLDHVRGWIAEHDPEARPAVDAQAGRYFGFGHGGLIRRPLTGGWQGQGAPGYRTASAVLGDRRAILADPERALDALVLRHVRCHGPSSRHDLAWWAGIGLRVVDASLDRLADVLTVAPGPDGRSYHDVPPPHEPGHEPTSGVRLLPEFDALLCAYEPSARQRFVTTDHHARLWGRGNGLMVAPLLVDGRITGHWRLTGSGKQRDCEITWFAGTRQPRKAELDGPVAALTAAYAVSVGSVSIDRG